MPKKGVRLSLIPKEFSHVICGFRTRGVSVRNVLAYFYISTLHPSSLTEHVKAAVVINAFQSPAL
jgi:hypothetical protein